MSNINVTKSGPEVFIDNETGYHDSYTRNRDYRPPQPKPIDYRVYAVWGITAIGGLLVFFLVYSLWKFAYCYTGQRIATCAKLDAIEPVAFLMVLLLPILLVTGNLILKYITRTRYENALANRANLVLNRFGDNEPADLFKRADVAQIVAMLADRYLMATALERTIASTKVYRGVNSLSLNNTINNDNLLTDGAEDTLAALPPHQWLPYADRVHHILIAGSTGEGKTVTAKSILLARLQAGENIFIIDPHSSNWYGLAGRAGGEDWEDAQAAIADIFTEYKDRIQQRHQHLLVTGQEMREDYFTRLNVLVDEAFLIKENLDTGTSKRQVNYWSLLAEILSSGARKVGISLILLTQTANVEDLGISGPLRRNFFRIAVDAPSIRLMISREETDHARRQQLYEALIGLQYPATAEMNGQIHLLDRLGLLPMSQTSVDAKSRLWLPSVRLNTLKTGQQSSNGRTDGNIVQALTNLRRQGFTRDEARDQHGLIFTNEDWTIAGEILASENTA